MIKLFVDRFMAKQGAIAEKFKAEPPGNYESIVSAVAEAVSGDGYDSIDPSRIHKIDGGDYQGTLLFVIAAKGYQPSRYWYVKISYGSCSGCDTLEAIRGYSDEPPSEQQIKDYMTLALHIVQGLKEMDDDVNEAQ